MKHGGETRRVALARDHAGRQRRLGDAILLQQHWRRRARVERGHRIHRRNVRPCIGEDAPLLRIAARRCLGMDDAVVADDDVAQMAPGP